MAIAIDPDWAQRRYEQVLAEGKVVGHRNPDESASLSGHNLPVDRVAAACGRIDALVKAAKRAGESRPIDHARAELYLSMTEGSYAGLDDAAILEHLHHRRRRRAATTSHPLSQRTGTQRRPKSHCPVLGGRFAGASC